MFATAACERATRDQLTPDNSSPFRRLVGPKRFIMMPRMCAEFSTQTPIDEAPKRRLEGLRRAAVFSRADVGTYPLAPTSRSLAERLAVHSSRRRHAS
jgi:hypothetical protein